MFQRTMKFRKRYVFDDAISQVKLGKNSIIIGDLYC